MFQDCHLENMWFGQTITGNENDGEYLFYAGYNTFLSIEPLLGEFKAVDMWKHFRWVIIGAETGNRKGKIIPKREWIDNIVKRCRDHNVPVFLKNNLASIWGEPLIQEYPWGKEAI
jgi:protein gp37